MTRRDYGPVQLADYLRACWPDIKGGSLDNARTFGLIPEPDRARGRWSAALAEQIRAAWPETAAAAKCIGAYGLKERGWTEAMIRDLLGDPDLRVDNPHYKSGGLWRLWRLQRVEAAEAAPGFAERKERADSQRAAAAKGTVTKKVWIALGGYDGRWPGVAGHG